LSEINADRLAETRRVEAGESKSLDSLDVAPPAAVETPMSVHMDTAQAPTAETAPTTPDAAATPPTDFDG